MSNVLITGGSGFIGSHLTRELVKMGNNVTVFDNLFRSDNNSLKDLIESKKIKFIKGDVRDEQAVDSAVKGMDYVFHLAAVCINYSVKFPKESLEINLMGSENVFRAALKRKVKRIIFSSSASVYGDPKVLPMKEDSELKPVTPYCLAKLASEHLLKFYGRSGLNYNILRYFNVYGVGQKADAYYTSVISLFIKRILSSQAPVIDGEGKQSMDFVNVKDIVQANVLAMNSETESEIYNVGTGISTTIADLADILIKSLKVDVKPEFNKRDVIVSERRADISKIQKIGFKVTVSASDGLSEVAKDIAENLEKY
ncbi:TPA: SDR family NAD(P)-dependent oxidoreductase [Candidatus Woesearchaeota archaeon]|nr:SDR family NAD(P)-dependent oxidoreductase [Candidatus Woesearchaeota archaeon]